MRGGSANGVSAVLRAGATAWCPNHEAKALFGPGTARGGPSSCPTPRDVMLMEQSWPLHWQNPAWPWRHRPRCPPLPRLLGVTTPPPRRQSPPGAFRKGCRAPREAIPWRGGAVNKPGQQRGPRQGGTDAGGREAADRRGGQATLPSPWEGAASAGTFGTGGPHGSPHPGGSPFLAVPHPNQGFPRDIGDPALGTARLPAQPHRRAAEQQRQAEGWAQGVAAAAGGGGGLGGSRRWAAGSDPTGKDLGARARSRAQPSCGQGAAGSRHVWVGQSGMAAHPGCSCAGKRARKGALRCSQGLSPSRPHPGSPAHELPTMLTSCPRSQHPHHAFKRDTRAGTIPLAGVSFRLGDALKDPRPFPVLGRALLHLMGATRSARAVECPPLGGTRGGRRIPKLCGWSL